MKLITKQNIAVLNEILETGSYKPDPKLNLMTHREYEEMFLHYKEETNISIDAAIWSWYRADNIRMDNLDNLQDKIAIMDDFYKPAKNSQAVIFLLEVPDEIVYMTDAYTWSDYIADTPEDQLLYPYNWHPKVPLQQSDIFYIQAIFPTIEKDYVLDYKII